MPSSRRSRCTALLAVAGLLVAAEARALDCPPGARFTQASCGGDTCECALPCATPDECSSYCCYRGFCAVPCVCGEDGATVDENCAAGGCGGASVTPVGPPGGGVAWGLGLFALGALATGRLARGGRRLRLVIPLAIALGGGALAIQAATAKAPLSLAKGPPRTH